VTEIGPRGAPGRESVRSRLTRLAFNFYPCYRRTGARLTYVAADWTEVRLKLPLTWRTRGYWGTMFGGSMYAALDPVLVVMLSRRLGPDYVVWDKAASIQFLKAARSTLFAAFRVEEDEIEAIRAELHAATHTERRYEVALTDVNGVVHAACSKTLYIRRGRTRG
jgi:acyl-coenzyme A thioesterase PaaI-like protein